MSSKQAMDMALTGRFMEAEEFADGGDPAGATDVDVTFDLTVE